MPAPIALGLDLFSDLRQRGCEYVDKTFMIRQLIDDEAPVLLLPRPRRFGKTLNMTMLEAFFSRFGADTRSLFDGLEIARAGEGYWKHFRRYPTLFLTFKSIKPSTPELWRQAVALKLRELFERHRELLEAPGLLSIQEQQDCARLLDGSAESILLQNMLYKFTEWLHRATGERVLVLIDEYDTPVHSAWLSDRDAGRIITPLPGEKASEDSSYRAVVEFYRGFLGTALKGNEHLYKGVMTGILRVSKESIFSDLNNIVVETLLERTYWNAFGFTEAEVEELAHRQEITEHLPVIQAWYNGYLFGDHVVYNPWSVLNFARNPVRRPRLYWVESSSNELIKHLLRQHALSLHADFETLLSGGELARRIRYNVVFPELERSVDTVFSLLLFAGYLKARTLPSSDPMESPVHAISIPNLEIQQIFRESFEQWLGMTMGGDTEQVEALLKALLGGETEQLELRLNRIAQYMLSTHDGDHRSPEALYHGLILGLCASLEPRFEVRSNRESGEGRPDLMIRPRHAGEAGAVLELKVARRGRLTLKQALAQGRQQLETLRYETELEARGAHPIHRYVVAFDGKKVKVEKVLPLTNAAE